MRKKTKIFRNCVVDKKQLKKIMSWAFNDFGIMKASYLANKLKDIGFQYATQAGLSISIEDLRVPPIKSDLIKLANKKVYLAEFAVNRGEITEVERFQKIINTWNLTSETLKEQVINYFRETDPLNSVYMMAFSGARGNLSQVRQLVGMRGLMADPNGQIIDLPIVTNFREGLTVTDYIISSYGARKGLVDTALRTADSGYLTRRLIDVAQDMITREKNCKTKDGISLINVLDGTNLLLSLEDRIIGRLLSIPIKHPETGALIAQANQDISSTLAKKIAKANLSKVRVRSPLTCGSSRSVCQQCYGWNLAYGNLIDLGEAVGIIAAQSIGEPGTQLTMRTFHTGGVFTAESSRQIRAQFSGKILFSKFLKTQVTRTQYGEIAYISENEASLILINYNNLRIDLEVLPETLILVKDNSFIKKNDILFELSSKTRKTGGEKAFKYVYANQSGEVLLENENTQEPSYQSNLSNKTNFLVWVLSGQVYNIPLKSLLQIKANYQNKKNQTIAEAKLVSITGGTINFKPFNTKQNNALTLLHKTKSLKNKNVYLEQTISGLQKIVLYGSYNRRIILNTLIPSKLLGINPSSIGQLINLSYRAKTGGIFYSSYFNNEEENVNLLKNKIKGGGTLFYLPESTYTINQNIKQFYVASGDFIKANTEIFKDTFSKISGIVQINENKKIVKEIVIKPGRLIRIDKDKNIKYWHQKILYPGEILLETIIVSTLSFSELKIVNCEVFLAIYPIVRYEITSNPNEYLNFSSSSLKKKNDIWFGRLQSIIKTHSKIKDHLPIQLIKQSVFCKPSITSKNYTVKVQFSKKTLKKSHPKLNLLILENLSIDKFIPNELKKVDIAITNLVCKQQYTEPYSTVVSFQVLNSEKNKLHCIKEQYLRKERKVVLIKDDNYKKIYLEQAYLCYSVNALVKYGEKLKTNFSFKNSGFISKVYGNSITIHLGQPYLFSQRAVIERRPGDLIKQGDGLGQLIYERARTGDIVQGLPRVEEILEARKPKLEAKIAKQPGIIIDITYKQSKIYLWVKSSALDKLDKNLEKDEEYILPNSQRLLVSKFEFINVAQPLNDASINPHTILEIYFLYYQSLLLTTYYSAYRSLRKIQAILLNSVQGVYYSQGVNIADKHIEIIIKQMTGKVQVSSPGDSPLFPDEFVDLRQVYYINNCLLEKENALFRPVLLGITKASLKTNSFISAASFQHTTRVLTEAAIQGKIDWLRGLKENVIVGRLIPAGTGFNAYSDISYIGVKLPFLLTNQEITDTTSYNNSSRKWKKLKNNVKFKFSKSN